MRDAEFKQSFIGWHAVHDHDIHRQRDAIADSANEGFVLQAGNEEARRARIRVCVTPSQSCIDRLCWIPILAQKQVRPSIDEEPDAFLFSRPSNGRNPTRLAVDLIERGALDDPVFKVDADHAQIDKTQDVVSQLAVIFTIPALEVRANWNVNGNGNPSDDMLEEPDWDDLTGPVTLGRRDGPAACCDCFAPPSRMAFCSPGWSTWQSAPPLTKKAQVRPAVLPINNLVLTARR